MSSQARETKAKTNYWGYINLKNFFTVKETFNKIKRQPTKWDNIFSNDIFDKVLL